MNYLKNNFWYKCNDRNKIKYYDRIDVSEGNDVNKTSKSKQCKIYHYWYFLNKRFKFETVVYNGCHDLL